MDSLFLSRRRLLKATGGLAATAVAGSRGLHGIQTARAQDAVSVTLWGNHPEWKDPTEEIIQAFQTAVPGVEIEFSAVTSDQYGAKVQTALAGGQTSDIFGEQEGGIIVRVAQGGDLPYADLNGQG